MPTTFASMRAIRLSPCCLRTVQEINETANLGRLLRGALVASPFAVMFGTGPIETTYTILDTEWDDLVHAVGSVSVVTRAACYRLAFAHWNEHSGGDIGRFWERLADAFQ